MTFSVEYAVDCKFDNVKIFDGRNESASLLGKPYCGTAKPPRITSTNDQLFVFFKTDKSVTNAGFKIRYSAISRGKYKFG